MGQSLDDAVARVREPSIPDPYSFFNIVHFHRNVAAYFSTQCEREASCTRAQFELPFLDREGELHEISVSALNHRVTTVLSPVGFGGHTLLSVWAELHERSPLCQVIYVDLQSEKEAVGAISQVQLHASRIPTYLVANDRFGLLSTVNLGDIHVVRAVPPHAYEPIEGENIIVLRNLSTRSTLTLGRQLLHSDEAVQALLDHPLGVVPGFVERVRRNSANSFSNAAASLESDNHMTTRFGRLNEDGRRLAGLLYVVRGEAGTNLERTEELYAIPRESFIRGMHNLIDARVAVIISQRVILAPDFLLLGEKWFPNSPSENRELFLRICAVFARVASSGDLDEQALNFARGLFGWAVNIEDWETAKGLLFTLVPWYAERGRLEELLSELIVLNDNVTGITRLVTCGHIGKILTEQGRFGEALEIHRENEEWLRQNPHVKDFHQNLAASLTGQIDCYTNLGRPEKAARKISEAMKTLDEWKNATPDIRPRVLAQIGELQSYAGRFDDALATFRRAAKMADATGQPGLKVETHHSIAHMLWRLGRIEDADEELNRIEAFLPVTETSAHYSKILDLKGRVLEAKGDPRAIDYILESYELDRQRGDYDGVAVSLTHVVRHYLEHGDLDRAYQRLSELIDCIAGTGSLVHAATAIFLQGEYFLKRREKERARHSFLRAAHLDSAAGRYALARDDEARAKKCE